MTLINTFRSLFQNEAAPKATAEATCCGHGDACEMKPKKEAAGEVNKASDHAPHGSADSHGIQNLEVIVEKGYRPARLSARAGVPIHVTFQRNETSGCSKEVVFPALGIRRPLPTGERVTIEIPAQSPGLLPFTCGMAMMKGAIDVR